MRHVRPGTPVAVIFLAALVGCSSARTLEQGASVAECARCHGFPPSAATGVPDHPAVASDATVCATCHSDTVAASGEIIAGGAHQDGDVDVTASHALPYVAQHTPAALADIQSCKACHGDDYAGGSSGTSCTACHEQQVGIASWTQNCTFCHGTRTDGVTTATSLAAPPQSVVATPDQTNANPKVGAHQRHFDGNFTVSVPCASCHAVPTTEQALTHFTGGGAQGAIAFSAVASKGVTGAAYAGGTCNVYCHGAGTEFPASPAGKRSPAWTDQIVACTECHGFPPASGPTIAAQPAHLFHFNVQGQACTVCHPMPPESRDRHVDGEKTVVVQPSTGGPVEITGWDCGACHAALGVD